LRRNLARLMRERSGTIAIVFSLATVPLIAATGLAIDYTRLSEARQFLQNQTDYAALNLAAGEGALTLDKAKEAFQRDMGTDAESISVDGRWLSDTDYELKARGVVHTAIMQILPGVSGEVPISVMAVARVDKTPPVYKDPELASLDPEAADYNRIYAYCFDPAKRNDANRGRSQLTPISDNAGSRYNNSIPQCRSGENLSYMLHNVANARTNRSLWDSPSRINRYYTDTETRQGRESYDLDGWNILETVLCPSKAKCKPNTQGGVIPTGKNRNPQRATEACGPGKYMYFGWEDRPPAKPSGESRGASDRDYDDIRVIIQCPEIIKDGEKSVRLIR
jgi:hypothetical protein